jgi:hypothetical protein
VPGTGHSGPAYEEATENRVEESLRDRARYVEEPLTLRCTRASFSCSARERGANLLFDIDRSASGWSLEAVRFQGEESVCRTPYGGAAVVGGRAE